MSVFLGTAFAGNTYPLTHGRLCWKNIPAGTVSAAGNEADGFPAVNADSIRTDNAWRPTAFAAVWVYEFDSPTEIDFIAIANHDLGTQNATIRFQVDVGSGFTSIAGLATVQPDDDSPIIALFTPITVDKFRISIVTADDFPTISFITGGTAMEMPRPFEWTGTPITEGDAITYEANSSINGNFLGRSRIGDGLQFDLVMNNAPESWRVGEFAEFKQYANGNDAAFFVAARPSDYPDEVAFAWCTETVKAERGRPNKRISTDIVLPCQGLRPYV